MSEVKRWKLKGFLPGVEGECKAVFQPTVVMAEDHDRVTAERDALQALLTETQEDLQEAQALSESRGRQSSAFEERMGNLQILNGKLQQRLTAADERADVLATALNRIQFRCQSFIEGDRAMAVESVEAVLGIAEAALKPAEPEPYQGIPGTSFQRLNALANQGE